MTIDLTDQQKASLQALSDWYEALDGNVTGRGRFFLLDGGAGTGKTTVAGLAAEALECVSVAYAAYTAKAAAVMLEKGMAEASTLHRLMYFPRTDGDGKLTFKFYDGALTDLDLLVVDESSMVPTSMVRDLMSTGTPCLVLGDLDGQLPPIKEDPGFFEWTPDYRLLEPHRSVLNSPVDRMAWLVRKGAPIQRHMADGDSVVIRSILDPGVWDIITDPGWMVVCGKHKTRWTVVRRAREKLGFAGQTPCPGEPLICCHNNYDEGFYNGQLVNLWRLYEDRPGYPYFIADLLVEGEVRPRVRIARHHFSEHLVCKQLKIEYYDRALVYCDWAYAITCHKAQGSEWPRVCVIDDQLMKHDRDFRRRWLYTAVTRASSQLVVLQTS